MAFEQKKRGVLFGKTSNIEKEGLKFTGQTITNVSISGFPKKEMAAAAFEIKKSVDEMVAKKYFHPEAISQLSVDADGEYPSLKLISPNAEMVDIAKKAIESVDFEKIGEAVKAKYTPKDKGIVLGNAFQIDKEDHQYKGQFKIDGNISGFSKSEMGSAAYHLAQELRHQNIPGVNAISNYKTDDGFHKLNFRVENTDTIPNIKKAIESVDFEKIGEAVNEDMAERYPKQEETLEGMQKQIEAHTGAIDGIKKKIEKLEQEKNKDASQETQNDNGMAHTA